MNVKAIPDAHWRYLEALRRSGVTNMFGAAPYIEVEFGCSKEEARRILADWMQNYNRGDYDGIELPEVNV